VVIEDTGKTWPTLDLKVGLSVSSKSLGDDLMTITDEMLLSVSPFTLRLLTELLREAAVTAGAEPYDPYVARVVRDNRQILRTAMQSVPLTLPNEQSRTSFEWLRLPRGWSSTGYCRALLQNGLAVLPGGPFFWQDERIGDQFVRIALARRSEEFTQGVAAWEAATQRYGADQREG
jgi:DNA-binding transcriptional MocR family regulator